jgi:hypothetical protein
VILDEEEVYVKMPADLMISAEKARSIVQDIAKVRLEKALVQAVALLRQKKKDGVVCTVSLVYLIRQNLHNCS